MVVNIHQFIVEYYQLNHPIPFSDINVSTTTPRIPTSASEVSTTEKPKGKINSFLVLNSDNGDKKYVSVISWQ